MDWILAEKSFESVKIPVKVKRKELTLQTIILAKTLLILPLSSELKIGS